MTSATGEFRRPVGGATPFRGPARGFTLIEVMVVIAIIVMLVGVLGVGMVSYRRMAAVRATAALIQRLDLALGKYKELFGEYPPDGIDSEVTNENGDPIRGSACLHHFLSRELDVKVNVGGERRTRRIEPLMDFREVEILESTEVPGVFEVVDAFMTPIHYDNTENGDFVPQDGDVHSPAVDLHPPDPRERIEDGAVEKVGIQIRGFDIWSHGAGTHREIEDLSETIGTWNLSVN